MTFNMYIALIKLAIITERIFYILQIKFLSLIFPLYIYILYIYTFSRVKFIIFLGY